MEIPDHRTENLKKANLTQHFLAAGAIASLLTLSFQAQAALTFNVSGDAGNPITVSGGFTPTYWDSGDLQLPSPTAIGNTPLELDVFLSHSVTLQNSEHFGYILTYDGSTPIAPGDDLGGLTMTLLLHGNVVASSVGFDAGANNFQYPAGTGLYITQFGTGSYDAQLKGATFDEVELFVSTPNPNSPLLADVRIGLDVVPEPSTCIAGFLSLGLVGIGFLPRKP
jgi:hypothetical protein